MTWNPTNADDVSLVVSQVTRDETGRRVGSRSIVESEVITVDDFSIGTEEDLEGLSGVGNAEALGVSRGDIEHSFSFTVMGEDANTFLDLVQNNGRSNELEIIVTMEDYRDKLTRAYAGTRDLSGSSGDAMEYEVEGIAVSRDPSRVDN